MRTTTTRRRRVARHLTGWLAAALCLTLWSAAALAGELVVEVLDVGQGDAILVRTDDKTILIDGGPNKDAVTEALAARGIERVDLMVATHPHADHIAGLATAIDAVDVGVYLDNGMVHTSATYERLMETIEARGVRYLTARRGQTFKLGTEARVEVLFPGDDKLSGTRSDLNSNSVVLRLVHDEVCFLFTGDAEEPTEHALLEGGLASCQVLKVAHHGGNHSSSDAFLDTVDPDIALVSCGEGNSYGHPGDETMARLTERGIEVHRTDTAGLLRVVSDGRSVSVHSGEAATAHLAPADAPPPVDLGSPPVLAATPGSDGRINVNTATASALTDLPGIGESKARAIVEEREQNGPFASCRALTRVHGIGDKTVDKLADRCRTQ